jgi:hypothetical protein
MKIPALIILFLIYAFAGCPLSPCQATMDAAELEQLKSIVRSQQNLLDQQQAEIQALQLSLAEQKQILAGIVQPHTEGGKPVPAVTEQNVGYHFSPATRTQTSENQAAPVDQEPPLSEQEKVAEELQRGPEIADITPDTPALKLGPAKVRLLGYPAMTTLWRSTNSGGNVGTNFANLPFNNTVPGTTSEFRVSAQSTRLALRVDTDLASSNAAGYFEMDFGGAPNAGNIAVTASSYTFRIRQAWFDWGKGRWELTGGQLFSLMTPNKKDLLPWPGDVAVTQAIDINSVAGLVWGRYPQFRVVYHASKQTAFGFSAENPEQQVGNNVVFPSALSSILTTQYNTGGNELSVPNMTPDFVVKGSFDGRFDGDRAVHFDVGAVVRTFRSWSGTQVSGKDYAFGSGVGANFNVDVVKGARLVMDGFASDGAGRYIGGLAPDVIVKANGSISPIHSYSWVSGFEIAPNKITGLYAYYSGLYAQKNATLNSNGSCCVGFGYPGANTNADRLIEEATTGYSRVFWKYENIGSMQWGVQYAYAWLYPWVAGNGPNSAHANMLFGQVRYNLP